MTLMELTPPEDREASLRRVRRLLTGEIGPYSVERQYVRRDGSWVWVSLSVSLVRGPAGEPRNFVCAAEDTTERKTRKLAHGALTAREHEIVALMLHNCSNAEKADAKRVGLPTIKTHIKNALRKLSAKNRSDLLSRYLPEELRGVKEPPPDALPVARRHVGGRVLETRDGQFRGPGSANGPKIILRDEEGGAALL